MFFQPEKTWYKVVTGIIARLSGHNTPDLGLILASQGKLIKPYLNEGKVMNIIEINKPLLSCQDTLGESPLWDHRRNTLFWVDIDNGLIHSWQPSSQKTTILSLGEKVGSVAMHANGGFLLATESGLSLWDPESGHKTVILPVSHPNPDNLFNDGEVDPLGRFWIGSKGPRGTSALWLLQDNVLNVKISELWISNGLDWSVDGRFFYHTDSGDRTIYRYSIDLETAELSNRIPFFTPKIGTPDGMTIDKDGNIWTAIWDGWKVLQLNTAGEVLTEIRMPVQRPTSVTFGGEDLSTLFITSASEGLTRSERLDQPFAGDLFSVDLVIPGILSNLALS